MSGHFLNESKHFYSYLTDNQRAIYCPYVQYRSNRPEVFCKKVFLEVLQNSQENTSVRVSFSIKLQTWALQLYEKGDFGTGVFLWMLRKFQEHFFTERHWWLLLTICNHLSRRLFILLLRPRLWSIRIKAQKLNCDVKNQFINSLRLAIFV